MKKETKELLALGGVLAFVGLLVWRRRASSDGGLFVPSSYVPPSSSPASSPGGAPPPAAAPSSSEAVHLTGSSIPLDPGRLYMGAVSLSWPISSLATKAKVEDYARSKGFVNVVAFKDHPPGWPGPLPDADWYVFAQWGGAPSSMDRPSQLVDAWASA